MKRSKFAGLAFMGAAPFLLVACGDEPQSTGSASAYKSVQECIDEGIFTERACTDGFAAAREQMPRYGSMHSCEADHGNCQQVVTREGGSVFMPAMMGFMVGHMLGGNRAVHHQPIYQDRENRGDWSMAVGQSARRMPQSSTNTGSSRSSSGTAKTASRSGFGSGAAARGGWGS